MTSDKKHGINKQYLDESINPKDDFYQYADGGWIKENPIPPEFASYGMFDALREKNRLQIKDLIMGLCENPESKIKGTNAQKVSDIYNMAMDMERRNKLGAKPLEGQLKKIESLTKENFIDIVSYLHNGISSVFFSTGVGPDQKDSDINIMHIGEAGLTLGDRDYYLEKDENNDRIMAAYEIYVKKLMGLVGYDEESANRVWQTLIKIEKEFAKHKRPREEWRDPLLTYNMLSFDEIKKEFPVIDWQRYFSNLEVNSFDRANVSSPGFLMALNEFLPKLSLQELKDYMTFKAVNGATDILSDEFFDLSFEFFDHVMSGTEKPHPLWKRAMGLASGMLGEVIGELYVEKYFPEENKKYMLELVENLRKSLKKHIENLSWMGDATKAMALDKLAAMTVKIGYPDKWKDYSEIKIDPELSLVENVLEASKWYIRDNYSKLGKPVDKTEWFMYPQTVNAYYSPMNNEICFPAGILQAPYFDITADDALNYGAIGVVIGHEMTHGFDDQGRQFDKNGNLSQWWDEEDAKRFNKLADKLVAQFDAIEVLPGEHANGRFTLGENIADQGGIRIALTAYKDLIKNKPEAVIEGFTPLQRFFLAYAQVWAGNIRDKEILVRIKSDPHSLGRLRVNATLKNIDAFLESFDIKAGDKMYRAPEDRVIIW